MSFFIENYKVIMVDIDETLIIHDSESPSRLVDFYGRMVGVRPHLSNIALVQKFHALNYSIVFWSRTGADWAKLIVEELGLAALATGYMTKPLFYVDDRACEEWMGERVFKEPV